MLIRKLLQSKFIPWTVLSVLGLAPLLMAGAPKPISPPTSQMRQEQPIPTPEVSEENIDPTASATPEMSEETIDRTVIALPEIEPTWSAIIVPLPEVQEPISVAPITPEVAVQPNINFQEEPVSIREEIPLLAIGAINPIVADVQNYLEFVGVYDDMIDGIYGEETGRAIRELQRENNQIANDRVGVNNWLILRNETDVEDLE